MPTLTLSLHPTFQYRGFDLTFLLQGVTGRTSYFGGPLFQAFQNNGQVAPIALDRWTPATAETATYPRLSAANNLNNFQYSTFWQRNGSFAKLRSLELGYTLPASFAERIQLNTARVFLNGTNLLSFDSLTGVRRPRSRQWLSTPAHRQCRYPSPVLNRLTHDFSHETHHPCFFRCRAGLAEWL